MQGPEIDKISSVGTEIN